MSTPLARQPAERTFSARNVIVVQTYVVQTPKGDFYYEIYIAPDDGPDAHRTGLVTRDELAYKFALQLERNGAKVNASWHHARRGNHRYAVLDTLEAPVS